MALERYYNTKVQIWDYVQKLYIIFINNDVLTFFFRRVS